MPPHLGWERKPGYLSFNASSRLVPLTASSRKPLLVLAFSLLPEPTHPPPTSFIPLPLSSSVASWCCENSPHFASQTHCWAFPALGSPLPPFPHLSPPLGARGTLCGFELPRLGRGTKGHPSLLFIVPSLPGRLCVCGGACVCVCVCVCNLGAGRNLEGVRDPKQSWGLCSKAEWPWWVEGDWVLLRGWSGPGCVE